MIVWPDELIGSIARRKCVIFLGSGVSSQAQNAHGVHPKTWKEFLEAARDEMITDAKLKPSISALIKTGDYLTACQVIKDNIRDDRFHDFLKREFLDPNFSPAAICDDIINLDVKLVATPNFDKLYETRANYVQQASVAVKHYYDNDVAEVVRDDRRTVIKIHGSIDTPSKMIFTRLQYAKARNEHRSFYSILEALAITHTFLFLGSGLSDPDIRLVLEDYAFGHSIGKPHYFVVPKTAVKPNVVASVENSMNIRLLIYDPSNNHAQLQPAVANLVSAVVQTREDISRTGNW